MKLLKMSKIDGILYAFFTCIIFLILILNMFNISNYTFLLFSILANVFIIFLYKKSIKLLNIKFSKK